MRKLNIDILTLFPGYFRGPFTESIVKRALEKKILDVRVHDIRDYTNDKRRTADDIPYGGGAGMVMKPEPLLKAIRILKKRKKGVKVFLMSPQGKVFNHALAMSLSREKNLLFICGHYEGIDERAMRYIDGEISLGDFVLTGGEPAAAAMVDCLIRFQPGAVGDRRSVEKDSFFDGLLDYPHYTRPRVFQGMEVPDMLLSGNHALINSWRKKESIRNTWIKRPDLLDRVKLLDEERKLLIEVQSEGKTQKKIPEADERMKSAGGRKK